MVGGYHGDIDICKKCSDLYDADLVTPAVVTPADGVSPVDGQVFNRPGTAAVGTDPGLLGPPWPLESWVFIPLKGMEVLSR